MNPSDLVQEIGQRLNLTGLKFTDGACRLLFDQTLAVDLEDDGAGQLVFHTALGPVPHDHREAFFRALLTAHLFGFETDGAVFGVHPQSDEIYLFRTLAIDGLSVDQGYSALERFTHQAESWRQKISQIASGTPSAASEPNPAFSGIRA